MLRGQGSRTGQLGEEELVKLGLDGVASQLGAQAGRNVSFVIYRSRAVLEGRGPNLRLP